MYAVIFTAEIRSLDDDYFTLLEKMRNLAIKRYGCVDVVSVNEGNKEITISYWQDQEDISQWKQDVEHLRIQKMAKEKWYKSYHIQVLKLIREYGSNA